MKIFLKKKVLLPIISVFAFVLSLVWAFASTPNVYAADLKTVVLKSTDFTGEGEGSDNPWTLSNSSWALSNLAFYNYWNKDEIKRTEDGQGSAFSSSITYNNPSKYAIVSVKVYGAGQNHSNTVNVSVTCGSETTDAQTVTKDGTDLTFNLSTNPTSSVVVNFQHPAHTDTATIELTGTDKGNVTFIEITAKEVHEVSISSGTGVKSVYLSTNQNATSGSSSGTKFDKGTTVYGFAKLAKGYKAKSDWTLVSGSANTENAIYRIGSKTVGSSAVSFGTISADLITYTIGYTLNGGSVSGNPTSYNVTSNAITLNNPTKTGYTFNGWTGSNGTTPQTSVSIAKGSIGNKTYTANWTANTYTVTLDKQEGTDGSNSVTATYNSAMPSMTRPTRTGYTFGGYYTETNGEGTQYYNANGESAKNWDKTSDTTLYAKWTLLPVIQDVIDNIDTIGTVAYPNSKSLINTARDAYDALDDSYKTLVSNYETLTTAEATYDNLKNTAVNNVKNLIDAIGEVKYPDSKNDIIAAEEAYANLDNDEKNVTTITNYETLTDAITTYDTLKDNAVEAVITAINNIGEVKYPDSKNDITLAKDLYDALDDDEQNTATITNYETLTQDITTYDNLRDAAIADVYDKIDVINVPLIYPNSNTELTTARTAFDKLDTDDKNDTIITNYQDLLDLEAVYSIVVEINEFGTPNVTQVFRDKVSNARNEYEELNYVQQSLFPDKELHILYNYETALVVMDIIQNIGLISYTTESKSKMDNAKESYDNLTNEQKELVTNYQVLTHDIEVYNHVDDVYKKINGIDEVKYEEISEEEINVARRSYDDLTDEEKALVVNYDKLTTDETTYKELRNDHITFVGWMIALAIMGGIILSLFISYILFFFVFNKWTLANNKAIRVFKIGKKNDKIRLLTITLMVIYRNEDEVFNKKSDVIK